MPLVHKIDRGVDTCLSYNKQIVIYLTVPNTKIVRIEKNAINSHNMDCRGWQKNQYMGIVEHSEVISEVFLCCPHPCLV